MPNERRVKLTWEEPPARRSPEADETDLIAAELKKRPGQWAIVGVKDTPHASSQLANSIRHGGKGYKPKGAFEAKARMVDGECRVYARYIGGQEGE